MADIGWQKLPNSKLQGKSITNWTRLDLWVLALTVSIAVAVGSWTNEIFGVLTFAFFLPILHRPNKGYGRTYYEVWQILKSAYISTLLKGVLWTDESDDTSSSFERWVRRHTFKPGSRRSPLPLDITQVSAEIRGSMERFSLMHERDRPYDHLIIAADGGSFFSKGVEQHDIVNTMGEIIDRVIAQTTNLSVGMSLVRITGPENPTDLTGYLRRNIDPLIVSPELFNAKDSDKARAEWLRRYATLIQPAMDERGTATSWYLIVLTIKRSSNWRKALRGQLSDKQLYELPIAELGRTFVDELSSNGVLGMKNVRSLGLAELATVIRTGWDVADIQEYYALQAEGKIPRTDEEIHRIWERGAEAALANYDPNISSKKLERIRQEGGNDAVYQALNPWPKRIIRVDDEHDYVQLDNNLITILRATKLPDTVSAEQYRLLHDLPKAGVWTRQAMVGQAVSGSAETQQLLYMQGLVTNINQAFSGGLVVQDPRRLRKQRELSERTDMVSQSTIGQHYQQLHTIIVPVEDDLSEAVSKMIMQRKQLGGSLGGSGFFVETVKGGGRLVDAAISGCWGINRL